ncbi:DUF2971 domain-containing protein [Algoriphagus pacificus]|uniref:DUF2971 domain-containing protein n=1 Tax=Algoriphagus pacificus TaxID=2811234 RepID=A0ABS3CLU8_9BACT|nr:DUF2971 domain-containing protein [Algoriphagus pacificus]MBN7818077.1 DUF2971 domain-containing protein [Algoriphagus pacificus]
MGLFDKPSKYKNTDYRSINYSGNWSRHFINEYYDSLDEIGIVETLGKLHNYKEEHLPKSLFKFCSPSSFNLSNLYNSTIYLSDPKSFNDPFDCTLNSNYELFKETYVLKRLKEDDLVDVEGGEDRISLDEYQSLVLATSSRSLSFESIFFSIKQSKQRKLARVLNSIQADAVRKYKSALEYLSSIEIGVSSFSSFKSEDELLKNTTMWSHYADHHRGFCIEYNLDFSVLKYENEMKCAIYPITYTAKNPTIPAAELLRLNHFQQDVKISKKIRKAILRTYTTKSAFWSYEKEWRIILDLNESYFQINRTIPFLKIKKIYLGCRIDHGIKKSIVNISDKMNIEVIATTKSDSSFKLQARNANVDSVNNEENNIIYQNISNITNSELGKKRMLEFFF